MTDRKILQSKRNQYTIHPPPSMYHHILNDIQSGDTESFLNISRMVILDRLLNRLLLEACLNEQVQFIPILLRRGANPCTAIHMRSKQSVMMRLCMDGDKDVIECLVDSILNPELNSINIRRVPLFYSICFMSEIFNIINSHSVLIDVKFFFTHCLFETLHNARRNYVSYLRNIVNYVADHAHSTKTISGEETDLVYTFIELCDDASGILGSFVIRSLKRYCVEFVQRRNTLELLSDKVWNIIVHILPTFKRLDRIHLLGGMDSSSSSDDDEE